MRRRDAVFKAGLAMMAPHAAKAQVRSYPFQDMSLLVPSSGTSVSNSIVFASTIAPMLDEELHQRVIVRPFSGGGLPPDGHTLLFANIKMLAIDPAASTAGQSMAFMPIASLFDFPLVLCAHSSMPNTLRELIDVIKASPGKYSYGAQLGSLAHMACELFKKKAGGLEANFVPFADSSSAYSQVSSGRIAWTWEFEYEARSSSWLRRLGYAYRIRSPYSPDVPTVAEAGLPGFEAFDSGVIVGPAGMAKDAVEVVGKASRRLTSQTSLMDRVRRLRAIINRDTTTERTAKFVKDQIDLWGPVVRMSGFKIG